MYSQRTRCILKGQDVFSKDKMYSSKDKMYSQRARCILKGQDVFLKGKMYS